MIQMSSVASSYLTNSALGLQAQSADAEDKNINDIIDEKTSLTDKSRFMDANTSIFQSIKLNFEAGVVGAKVGVQFKFKDKDGNLDKELNDIAEYDWNLFSKSEFFETGGKFSCSGFLRQVVKAEKGTEGEILVLHHLDQSLKFGYVTQILETSMIDVSKDEGILYDDNLNIKEYATVSGLKLGKFGRVHGVWIYDDGATKATSTLYTENQFTLYFNPHLRISQYRGISQIAGVVGTIQDTITYKNNELASSSEAAKTKNVHKTSVIQPLEDIQKQKWEQFYAKQNGMPTVKDFGLVDQSNSPTVYIGQDEEFKALEKPSQQSVFDTFGKNLSQAIAQNYNISVGSIMQGEENAVLAVIKTKKQENEIRYGIEQENLKDGLFETILNNFILANKTRWGKRKEFYEDKYKFYYRYTITLGTKTELDEVKSANARRINKEQNVIDEYQATAQLGNDLDTVLENNTRAKKKKIEELMKLLEEVVELNKTAEPLGMKYKLDENQNIVLVEEVTSIQGDK